MAKAAGKSWAFSISVLYASLYSGVDACGNSDSRGWGSAGSNGAQVEFTADGQDINGDIIVDSISTLDMTLTNGSCFTGRISIAANLTGSAPVENNAVITIGEGCT